MLRLGRDGFLYFANFGTPAPLAAEPDPERARWIDLCWHDPAAARREREAQRLAYWRARAERLRRLAELEAEPLPIDDGPKRRGPRITCTCGECLKCRARESMRRRRAAAKAVVAQ